jgi:hypothetical protein
MGIELWERGCIEEFKSKILGHKDAKALSNTKKVLRDTLRLCAFVANFLLLTFDF